LFVNSSQLKFEKKAFVPNFVKGLGNITKNKSYIPPPIHIANNIMIYFNQLINSRVIIVNDINNDIRLFADDTSLFVVVENDHAAAATSLTDDLNVISNWAKKWAIQFNPQKTKNIVFSRRDREHPPVYFHFPINRIPFLCSYPILHRHILKRV
jgi:hypothetical protein